MDPAVIALLGVLGGVIVTQISNYLLEGKRAKNRIDEKVLDIQHSKERELYQDRKKSYTSYLASLDQYITSRGKNMASVLDHYYCSLVISSNDVSKAIVETYNIIKMYNFKDINAISEAGDAYMESKQKLLSAIRKELYD